MTSGVYMQQLSVWVGTGIVTAGVSAALLAAAGVATADTGTDSQSGGVSSSGSTTSDAAKPDSTSPKKDSISPKKEADSTGASAASDPDADKPDSATDTKKDDTKKDDTKKDDESTSESTGTDDEATPASSVKPTAEAPKKKSATAEPVDQKPQVTEKTKAAKEPIESEETLAPAATPAAESTVEPVANHPATQSVSARFASPMSMVQAPVAADVTRAAPSLLGVVGSVIRAVVVNIGSIALTALQAVEALVAGPPVLPPGSTVTVRNSSITLSTGQRVAANWYYPEVDEGDPPPTRMILLNHGLLALGPMYSYTAANLAEETQSIVVTPSLPSNFFAGGTYWLGSTEMASAVADLFFDDRAALTKSALDAGYATQYGLDPVTAKLPQKFGLAGHSLGGNLVAAAAGFLAENGAADDLVGVITLDGVPTGTTMVDALRKLDDYEALTDHYIPIREIGAPPNLFNSSSNVKEALIDVASGPVQRCRAHGRGAHGLDARWQPAHPVRRVPRRRLPSAAEPARRRHTYRSMVRRMVRRRHRCRRRTRARIDDRHPHPAGHGARRRDRHFARRGNGAVRARGVRAGGADDHSAGARDAGQPRRMRSPNFGCYSPEIRSPWLRQGGSSDLLARVAGEIDGVMSHEVARRRITSVA